MGGVYTYPEERRNHYAENLVYQVSKIAFDEGWNLTLYTNADYAASNTCYRKIGYKSCGDLCMVEID